jgi:glycosyltransferase involved in cell wall biosynthesis
MADRISSLSIVFPCLNDAGIIGTQVLLAEDVARQYTDDFEVIVVDDFSTDGSRELLDLLAQEKPYLRVIKNEKNLGYGGAIGKGLYAAAKDYVFYTDGDAQYDVRELAGFLDALGEETAVINGYKITRSDPWYRIVLGRLYHMTADLLFNLPVRDVDCDFRLFRKEVLQAFTLECTGGAVCVELVKKVEGAGFSIVEIPVHHYFRIHGKSQFFTFKRVFRVLGELFSLKQALSRGKSR